GEWEIEKTGLYSEIPDNFSSKIPVPGLVDMADPIIEEEDSQYDNSLYWYRKTFEIAKAGLVRLKINMAKYHTKVYLNGQYVGENVYNFTPGIFDLKPYLEEGENELVISVGSRNNLPDTVINGHDFEKIRYIPGIYDDVKIISSGYPHINKVQTVPDIGNSSLRVVAEIDKESNYVSERIEYKIREIASGKIVAEGEYLPTENSFFCQKR
ncbi:MAG: sugar-binding domain-containing protein, partial [Bacteroidota bacterium]